MSVSKVASEKDSGKVDALKCTQTALNYVLNLLTETQQELFESKRNLDESNAIIASLEKEVARLKQLVEPKVEKDILGRVPHPSYQGGDCFC